jgi:hypothetical protein
MKKVVGLVLAVAVLAGLVSASAFATGGEPHKAFVCKYVGTPGVDERLQTGQNPIDVDFASLEGIPVVGQFFSDAQGRSVVIAIDVGQEEPGVESCPPPEGPPPTPHLFAAETVCNPTSGEFDVTGREPATRCSRTRSRQHRLGAGRHRRLPRLLRELRLGRRR